MASITGVFEDLVRAETRLYNVVDARVRAEHDLSLGGFELLGIVARIPGCRVGDIAAEIAITVGAASKAVDRLERAGLLRRVANPDDGRSSLLELTAAGERMRRQVAPVVEEVLTDRIEGVVSPEDLAIVARVLATLRASLEEDDATS